jgi:hypothetical protein
MSATTPTTGATPAPALPALQLARPLTYLSGGSQSDVYITADRRFVLKLKLLDGRDGAARREAAQLKRFADAVCAYLGPSHCLRTWFLVLADGEGRPLVAGLQPFLAGARPLDSIDADSLSPARRAGLHAHLRTIVAGSLRCYRATGRVADLYGYGRKAGAEARRLDPRRLLAEGWRLLSQRPLFTAHNLMLTADERVVLVDYDLICSAPLGCGPIYAARMLLLLRDWLQLEAAR